MTRRPPMDLADYVRELTEPHSHAEHYQVRQGHTWYGRNHVTRVPSLLTQLWNGDLPSSSAEDGPRPGYQSRPAARLDALDAAVRIDLEASRWVKDLGEDDPSDTAACVRRLHGLAASADQVTRVAILRDVRRWWTQARIVTGWDSAPWTPDNTCPMCGERGTLKVRLLEHIAMCTHDACRTTWDETSIGLLADHIREESATERPRREGRGPCWCPWPGPRIRDLAYLCPACGSARCRHAVHARLLAALASPPDERMSS